MAKIRINQAKYSLRVQNMYIEPVQDIDKVSLFATLIAFDTFPPCYSFLSISFVVLLLAANLPNISSFFPILLS